jgi:hypothetical protein
MLFSRIRASRYRVFFVHGFRFRAYRLSRSALYLTLGAEGNGVLCRLITTQRLASPCP